MPLSVRSLALTFALAAPSVAQTPPRQFESPMTSGLTVSADGLRMLAINTPDRRLLCFSLATPARPVLLREVAVALEPVAAAFATPHEAWVVCHLSDAVQVVDLDDGRVVATIAIGDEPADIRIADGKAFVTVATRREVAVVDVGTRRRLATIPVFGDEPRWLARSADGARVFVAAHKSGNGTTVVHQDQAPPQPPPGNPLLPNPPRVAKIVASEDPTFAALHDANLPDHDVFEIDTATLRITRRYDHVGTLLFGLCELPGDGRLFVANTDARNLVAFEPELRGHVADSRVSRIEPATPAGPVTAFDLNPQIDYGQPPVVGAAAQALSQPTAIVAAADGSELFVACFGNDRIAVLDPDTGAVLAGIPVGDATGARDKRGPRALAISPDGDWLYVLNRLSNTLSVVDVTARAERDERSLVFDPTPAAIRAGRGFLYDARLSGYGTTSCATCHVDATTDNLAWNLGDPAGTLAFVPGIFGNEPVHPMKGPMVTQTLLGIDVHGLLHWRGDRADFAAFNPTFDTLLAGPQLSPPDLAAFEAFVATLTLPPNPNRNPDGSLPTTPTGASASEGEQLFQTVPFNMQFRCDDCHGPNAPNMGATICAATLEDTQPFLVAKLGNVYKREGWQDPVTGERTAGFGLLHDGTDFDLIDLLSQPEFGTLVSDPTSKAQLAAFVRAFDTGTATAVGRALTIGTDNWNAADVLAEQAILIAAATAGDAGLVAFGQFDGDSRGFAFDPAQQRFVPDRAADPVVTADALRALAGAGEAHYTLLGVMPGEAERIGIDRDRDGVRDGDERAARYGQPTAGCDLQLRASSPARLGNDQFSLVVDGCPPGAPGLVVLAAAPATATVLGIDVLVDGATASFDTAIADPHGTAAVATPIPAQAGLHGVTFHAQAAFVQACGPMGLAATAGLRLTID